MRLRKLIASGLLLAVLMAPALGLALCNSLASAAHSGCMHCAVVRHRTASGHAPAPVAPCCERKAPTPALNEAAQIVAPVQVALMDAASPAAMLLVMAVPRLKNVNTPPQLAPPLSLLCTFLI